MAVEPDIEEDLRRLALQASPGVNIRVHCPFCHSFRKAKNKNDKEMSLLTQGDLVVYHCHHCGENGGVPVDPNRRRRMSERSTSKAAPQQKPQPKIDLRDLSPLSIAYLRSRGIGQVTADAFGLKEADVYFRKIEGKALAIAFPYFDETGSVVAYKFRNVPGPRHAEQELKLFTSTPGSKGCLFRQAVGHLEQGRAGETAYIVEGEIDALSLYEAGLRHVYSVPNGAGDVGSCLLDPVANVKAYSRIVICGDADEPGKKLIDECVRRLGKARTWTVSWPPYAKDANDVLRAEGISKLLDYVRGANPSPVAGVALASSYRERLLDLFEGRVAKGHTTGIRNLDEVYSLPLGFLSVVTGYPNEGKSELVDNLITNACRIHKWKTALWSAENSPEIHIAKLIEKKAKMSFFSGKYQRIPRGELDEHLAWVSENFIFINDGVDIDPTIDSILDRIEACVLRYGVKLVVIDPFNRISKPNAELQETEFIRQMLVRLQKFAQNYELHIFLVAHPRKPGFIKSSEGRHIPQGSDIASSQHFENIADFGLTVARDYDLGVTNVHMWKVRFKWHGRKGVASLDYDPATGIFQSAADDSGLERVKRDNFVPRKNLFGSDGGNC